ncbi:MAG TPA: aldose 1-epimerase family protein [Steroidobacteraceae bacterium]|nr:aldose 1-epimerase family protein [Steroidobacteraceae bacterium]
MPDPQNAWVSLRSPELLAEIDPLGAQLSILRDRAGRDLLWNGDPSVWAGRAPLLFPIVGALVEGHYRLGASSYALPRHGFARGKGFETAGRAPTVATFRLRADATTLGVYPFQFELLVRYAAQGAALSVRTTIRNAGETEMPASFGYHPAFRWPLPYGQERAAHFIEFDSDEPAPVRRLDAAGLLTSGPRPTPVAGRRLDLTDALFRDDVLIFDQLNSRSVTYGAGVGPRIQVSFPDARYVGLWTKPGAPFICIEPWHGIADPAGFTGDFTQKPGVFSLSPGGAMTTEMILTLLPAS